MKGIFPILIYLLKTFQTEDCRSPQLQCSRKAWV